jgi:phage protein U
MQYCISFLFFSLSKVQHNNLWKWILLNKEKEKRGKGQMVGMGEEKIGMEE